MPRTTPTAVKAIYTNIDPTISLDPFIEAANYLVNKVCLPALASDGVTPYYNAVDLELIERTGWDASKSLTVDALPTTAAGSGLQQSLKIVMPWPSPTPRAPIYIWLRGEAQGRLVESGRPK